MVLAILLNKMGMITEKKLSLLLIALIVSIAGKAQESIFPQQSRIDSAQRVLMIDSLEMTNAQVDTVFAIRNRHWQAIMAVRVDNSVTIDRQQELFEMLKQDTYTSMRSALGVELFERYVLLIANRTQRRGNVNGIRPLTGAGSQ